MQKDKYLISGVIKLKHKIKKIFLLLLITIFSCIPLFTTRAFKNKSANETSKLALLSSSNTKDNSAEANEDSDVFEFIKDKKNSLKDLFYDGSALLYGGILLIVISLFGLFKTLKPKKRRKKRKINRQSTIKRR